MIQKQSFEVVTSFINSHHQFPHFFKLFRIRICNFREEQASIEREKRMVIAQRQSFDTK
jgi:hypothetical protein